MKDRVAQVYLLAFQETLGGRISCGECGLVVTAEHKVNRFGSHYIYYHCTRRRRDYRCHQPSITENRVEEQITEFLRSIRLPDDVLSWGLNRIERLSRGRERELATKTDSLERARLTLDGERANLTRLRIRDLVNDDEFVRERQAIDREAAKVAQNLTSLSTALSWFEPARLIVSFSNEALSCFEEGEPRVKRLVLDIVGSNLSLKDEKLSIDGRKPFRRWIGTANVLQRSG